MRTPTPSPSRPGASIHVRPGLVVAQAISRVHVPVAGSATRNDAPTTLGRSDATADAGAVAAPAPTRRASALSLALSAVMAAAPFLPVTGAPYLLPGAPRPAAAAAAAASATARTAFAVAADRASTLAVPPAVIDLASAPDPKAWDPSDARLRSAANALQSALNAESLADEEAAWTAVVEAYAPLVGDPGAPWAGDVVARAIGNRGNARARAGGKMDAALADLNRAITLAPYSPDPVLNRGVVLEQSGRFDEAAADYRAVLDAVPGDPSAWNNLGNVEGLRGNWVEAEACFARAAAGSRDFSFTSANRAQALFQLGRDGEAVKELRRLLRRYPDFDDARAALAAMLWEAGDDRGAAETEWLRVADPRYRSREWLSADRHWPPRLVEAARALIDIK